VWNATTDIVNGAPAECIHKDSCQVSAASVLLRRAIQVDIL